MVDVFVLPPAARGMVSKSLFGRLTKSAFARLGILAIFVSLSAVWSPAEAGESDKEQAAKFLHELSARAEIMVVNQDMTSDQRQAHLEDLIGNGFDIEAMSRFVLAKHWKNTTAGEREEFHNLFRDYMLLTIGRHISSIPRFELDLVASRRLGENALAVRSNLAFGEKRRTLHIDWRLRRSAGRWRIADIVIQGISFAAVIRSEFVALIDSHDGEVESLLVELRKKSSQHQAVSG